ncbi:hypothetical protein COBT_001196 [Conglomerata obtusa]
MSEPQAANNEVSSIVNAPERVEVISDIQTRHEGSASDSLIQAENPGVVDAASQPSTMTGSNLPPIISKQSLNPPKAKTFEDEDNIRSNLMAEETTTADIDVAERKSSGTNVEEAIQHSLQSRSENNNNIDNVASEVENVYSIASDIDKKINYYDSLQSPQKLNKIPTIKIHDPNISTESLDVNLHKNLKLAEYLHTNQLDKESGTDKVYFAPTSNIDPAKLSDDNFDTADKILNDTISSQNIVKTTKNDDTAILPGTFKNLDKEKQENEKANTNTSVNNVSTSGTKIKPQNSLIPLEKDFVNDLNTGGKVSENTNRSFIDLLDKNLLPNEAEIEVRVKVVDTPEVIGSKANNIISNDVERKFPVKVVNNLNHSIINDDNLGLNGEGSKLSAQEVNKLDESNVEDDKNTSSDNQNTVVVPPADNKPVLNVSNDEKLKPIVDAKNDSTPKDNEIKEKVSDNRNELEKKEDAHTDVSPNPSKNQPKFVLNPSINAEEKVDKIYDATISEPKKDLTNDKDEKSLKDDKSALNASANTQEIKKNETQNPDSISKSENKSTESVVEKKNDGFFSSMLNYFKKNNSDGSKSSEFDPIKLCIGLFIIIVFVSLIGIGLINFLVKKSE